MVDTEDYKTIGASLDLVTLISTIETINLLKVVETIEKIDLITAISSITNIASVDLVDRITLIDAITNIVNIASLDLVDRITLIDAVTTISNITNIASLDLIDRITLIDTITTISNITNIASLDLVDRITLIDTITNIGTLANLTTVGTINAITNIANIASLDLVDRVTLIDTITNIGTLARLTLLDRITLIDAITNIGTLARLNLLDRITLIDSIAAITNIANLASIDLIDRVTLIDSITNIGNIGKIGNITDIAANAEINYIRNGGFETGTFEFWEQISDYVTITTASAEKFKGAYGCKDVWSGSATFADIVQVIPNAPISDNVELTVPCRHASGSDAKVKVFWYYTDDVPSSESQTLVASWRVKVFSPTAGKRVWGVGFCNDSSVGVAGNIWYDEIQLRIKQSAVTQTTRTSLLNKPEREDLLLKSLDFATSGELQAYLMAVLNQKHKIYAYGYEADADGTYYFSATVNGATWKFGRRITAGTYVQTFVHPIVCDATTVLNFMCTTGNAKTWIQYKTEA